MIAAVGQPHGDVGRFADGVTRHGYLDHAQGGAAHAAFRQGQGIVIALILGDDEILAARFQSCGPGEGVARRLHSQGSAEQRNQHDNAEQQGQDLSVLLHGSSFICLKCDVGWEIFLLK